MVMKKKLTESDFYGNVDYSTDIFFTLLKIGDLSSKIFDSPHSEWQKNALNYYTAVEFLESLVSPYLGKDYYSKMEILISDAIEKYKKLVSNKLTTEDTTKKVVKPGAFADVMLTIETANMKLRLILSELKKLQILIPRQYKAIY